MSENDALDAFKARFSNVLCSPIQRTLGLEIEGFDLSSPIDDSAAELLRQLWLDWRVLVFRDQPIDHAAMMRTAEVFGEPIGYPFSKYVVEGFPKIVSILSDQQTADAWHCDLSYDVHPAAGAVLRAISIPPVGGDTVFADGYAAYDSLSDEMKARLENLRAIHDFAGVYSHQRSDKGDPEADQRVAQAMKKRNSIPLVAHPIALTHPDTGRKTLFLNEAFCTQVIDMELGEGQALLAELWLQFLKPEHQMRVRWKPNSLVVWENLSTVHYAAYDYGDFRRHMERVTFRAKPLYVMA